MASPAIPQRYVDRATLTPGEVGAMLGKSRDFVDRLIDAGDLRAVKIRGSVLVIAYDLWRMLGFVSEHADFLNELDSDSLLDRLET